MDEWKVYYDQYKRRKFRDGPFEGKTLEDVFANNRYYCKGIFRELWNVTIPYRCPYCGDDYMSATTHFKTCYPDPSERQCYYCGHVADTRQSLSEHGATCEDAARWKETMTRGGFYKDREYYMRLEYYENLYLPYRRDLNRIKHSK
jgi:ubiquitin